MIEHVNGAIERAHRLTGMPRDEIMRRAFRGDIRLYALGSGLALGVGADQFRER
jgi:hypothetical protein